MEDTSRVAYKADLTPLQKVHVILMRDIVKSLVDTPMVLKGGTALLLVYGLDRFSEDLDFDSSKAMRLESRLQEVASKHVTVKTIDRTKDTPTVSRYRLVYESAFGESRLKIETSLRTSPTATQVIDGMRVYDLPTLIGQKITALKNRTKARDLYDVYFLAKHYAHLFTDGHHEQVLELIADLNGLEKRFKPAFEYDPILIHQDVSQIVVSLAEALHR